MSTGELALSRLKGRLGTDVGNNDSDRRNLLGFEGLTFGGGIWDLIWGAIAPRLAAARECGRHGRVQVGLRCLCATVFIHFHHYYCQFSCLSTSLTTSKILLYCSL